MQFSYKTTIYGCFIGYIVQAIVNNFIPLLFLTFQSSYGISIEKVTMLVTFNFSVQFVVDLLAVKFVDKIGYRVSLVVAHIFSAAGLILLTILPEVCRDPFMGILLSVVVYAVGGGLIEVLVSPVMESCPTDNKEQAMSLLHSFYCWGHVGVVLLSTVFFHVAGIENWKYAAWVWAVIPVVNIVIFAKTPIASLMEEDEEGMSLKELFSSKMFWLLVIMMLCSGASEQSVSQWASVFAEQGLGITKTAGDLAGPMTFAIMMGISRVFYGKYGEKIDLQKFMRGSTLLCIVTYLMISLSPFPIISLIGCAICGLSVGIMWPGTFSKAAVVMRTGGTGMFALLALAGDIGCSGGPTLVGFVTGLADNTMKVGILAAIIFPVLMLVCLASKEEK